MSDITKLYASYKAGYLGNNILDTYFSFIANIIINKDLTTIEDTQIADEFKKKYAIDLPLSFVRQVLGVGVRNNCFIEDARNADEIDEKKFLFLRTHKVVLDSLMNITKGDYARFDSKTYIEVYDDIQSKSQKMYRDEALAHEQTKQELKQVKDDASKDREKAEQDKEKSQQAIEQLNKKISDMEEKERLRLEKQFQIKVSVFGWLFTLIVAGIPYVISLVILELCKSQFTKWTHESIIYIAVIIILTFIIAALFKRMKSLIFKIVEKVLLWHKDK